MIDDAGSGQVALALAIADLIDSDPAQPIEQVDFALRLRSDAFADPADRAPRDPDQLSDGGLARVDRQPRRLILKRMLEPRAEVIPASPAHPATLALSPHRPDRDDDLLLIADLHVLDDHALQADPTRHRALS